jgi:aminoglycoside 3-N-acetyltransferase
MLGASAVTSALRDLGVRPHDTLWVHSGVQTALAMQGATPAEKVSTLLDGLERAVADGLLALPTFTYSFTRGEEYDIARTPSTVGVLGELFRRRRNVRRTADPIFSAALNASLPPAWADSLFSIGDTDCFGERSVFAYLREADAKILFIGIGFAYCTFVFYVEQRLCVPYRYFKDFAGVVRNGDHAVATTARYYVRDLDADVESFFDPLADALLASGAARQATLPRGPTLFIARARAIEAEARRRIGENPDFLLRRGHRPGLAVAR